jgi:hypothetical protein
LGERGFEIVNNFLDDSIGRRKIGAVFEALIFEPEDVEVELESPAVAAASVTGRALLVLRKKNF